MPRVFGYRIAAVTVPAIGEIEVSRWWRRGPRRARVGGPAGASALAFRPRRKRQVSEVAWPRYDGHASTAGTGPGSRASLAVALASHYREFEGPLDQTDRRPSRPLSGDGQGVLRRSDRREGSSGQGPVRRRLPPVRRLYGAAQRQGRRLRVLQGVQPRRDRAMVDARGRGGEAVDRLPAGHWPLARRRASSAIWSARGQQLGRRSPVEPGSGRRREASLQFVGHRSRNRRGRSVHLRVHLAR
jgi:hypothetical protein